MIQKLILILILTINISNAQVLYYDSLWQICNKEDASFYRVSQKEHDTIFVKDYYINGQLQMSGSYLDEKCEIKNGLFTFYYQNGQKSSEGFYRNNTREGDWKYWNGKGEEEGFVESMPEYPGGPEAMNAFIAKETCYPKYARKNNIQGRVVLEFIVGIDGTISDITVKKSAHPVLDEEAIRVISKMPKWKPGMQNNKPVFVKFTLPIVFKL